MRRIAIRRARRHAPLGLAVAVAACGQGAPAADPTPSASERLLARAIAFHDPGAVWGAREVRLAWAGTGSDGGERVAVDVVLSPDGSAFSLRGRYAGSTIDYHADGSRWSAVVDGTSDLDAATRERMRLHREDGLFWRSYFGFLAGLPMKLRDPGTRLDPEPSDVTFMGRPARALRVTYDPSVGTDTWYFYFDPETAQLLGCRFYHDETANDGEYIAFDGLIEADGLRLPRHRRWYVNADDRFLGADEIRALEVGS